MKIAHKRQLENGLYEEQSIKEHCENVAALAASFAEPFGGKEIAAYAGMLHDIGKYSSAFQRRINGSSEETDHSTAGAQVAFNERTKEGCVAAFCIGGHHAGLPNMGSQFDDASEGTLFGKLHRTPDAFDDYKKELTIISPTMPDWVKKDPYSSYFFTKMVYSALVDADYLDTEKFVHGGKVERNSGEPISCLLNKLNKYVEPWKAPVLELNKKRSEIFQAAVSKAKEDKGLFSLTVQTGGGKTVTSAGFALNHAVAHGMDRVIVVVPYMSIIEQTQDVYEKIFGKENVIAHYSNAEYHPSATGKDYRYLATENWDIPVVLTTAVQFFESLYSNRPSKCRKLHNIANSVIIFDEAQMLPPHLIRPCVLAITQLVQHYGCTAVLCTATQPALNRIISSPGFAPELSIRELCPDALYSDPVFSRVKYKQVGKLSDTELAMRMLREEQVLCVVNNRQQAKDLFDLIRGNGSFHLSTWMTPEHRRKTLAVIRERLIKGEVCRVVSTSLIEAGVDIDFPVVYRAKAGLDSIVQSGGRCNREGKRNPETSVVNVFDSDGRVPKTIEQNCTATQRVIDKRCDFESKDAIKAYFDFLLYIMKGTMALDQKNILGLMNHLSFETISEEFHMIDGPEYTIYIPNKESEPLLSRLKTVGLPMFLMRKLGKHSVNVSEKQFNNLLACGAIEQIADNAAILKEKTLYSEETGLIVDAIE